MDQDRMIKEIVALGAMLLCLSCTAQATPKDTAGEPLDPQLRQKICRTGQFCALTQKTELGKDTQGHRVFLIVNDETPQGDPNSKFSRCWRTEWWRVTFDGRTIQKADRIVTERENYGRLHNTDRADGPCGYGAGGGIEEVMLDGDKLKYNIEGGSGWRWGENKVWRLVPELAQLSTQTVSWWKMNMAFGHTTFSDHTTNTTRDKLSYTLCAKKGDQDESATAVSDQIPVVDLAKYPQFDWRRSELPAKLRVRADGKPEKDTAGFVITKTTARRNTDGTLAAISTVVLDNDKLLIEVDDPDVITGSRSWVTDSHLEIWLWPGGANASQPCLVPTWNKELMQHVPAEDLRQAEQATLESPSQGPIKPQPLYQWAIRVADGKVFSGFGNPDPGRLKVEFSKYDGRRKRYLIPLPASGPLTVAYSTRSVDGKQHLFGTSALRFGDPTSIGAIAADQELTARLQKEREAERVARVVLLPELLSSIEHGNMSELRQFLARDPKLANAEVKGGFTALMAAVGNNQIEAITILLDAGADVNAITDEKYAALHYAAGAKAWTDFRPLSKSAPNDLVSTELTQVPATARPVVAKLLLARGANVNARNQESETPLLIAVSAASGIPSDVELVKALHDGGADINVTDADGFTPLHRSLSVDQINPALVGFLLDNTQHPEHASRYGVTAVMLAAGNADTAILKSLLERRPTTIQARNENGSTAMHYAAAAGRVDNVKLLLARGANPNISDKNGETPLRQAQLQGFAEVVVVLKTAGAK